MTVFRQVHTTFWNDVKVQEEFTPEDKFFYLYLLTNPHTRQIGVYQITKKQIAFEMGYAQEAVNALLQRFTDHHKLVTYDNKTREIAIINWGKYNLGRAGKPVEDLIRKELKLIKNVSQLVPIYKMIQQPNIKDIFTEFLVNEGFNVSSTNRSTTGGQEKEKEKEKEKEEEKEEEKEKEEIPFVEILDYLNAKANTNYRSSSKQSRDYIKARWNEGFRLDDFKQVIDIKVAEWLNDKKMNKFVRPKTLFGTNFESYLNQKGGGQNEIDPNLKSLSEEYNFDF
ncbi:conserved phage C-terminal domain-containing protein [Bacillus massiliigorillae]|uniref:conserved phage C-terminal domain-containing protein n=1 Tax=Bacillus massiliigorillae TaxID=1243664 RepID=UPI0003A777FE|nr:conserved phage C-terminal domain-containing protein [Bacillus massiliigorillae]